MKEKRAASPKATGVAASLFDYVEMFVFAAAAVVLLLTFCLRICAVSGPSMNLTLKNGERIVISNLFYTPKQGDIIVFHQTSEVYDTFNEPIVKRVIATGGQHVRIDFEKNEVYVSDDAVFEESELLDESNYAYFASPNGKWTEAVRGATTDFTKALEQGVEVPQGHLFVMGDNRNNSADSRDQARVGFVDERRVLGKVLFRIAPFTTF